MSNSSTTRAELLRRLQNMQMKIHKLPFGNFVSALLSGGNQPLYIQFEQSKVIQAVKLHISPFHSLFRAPLHMRGIELIGFDAQGQECLVSAHSSLELSSYYEEFGGFQNFAVNLVQEPYIFHTRIEYEPWAVIHLESPVCLRGIKLYPRPRLHEAVLMQDLNIAIRESSDAMWEQVWQYPAIFDQFVSEQVNAFPPKINSGISKSDTIAIDAIFAEALLGYYEHYRLHHRFSKISDAVNTRDLIKILDEFVARPRGLRANAYGICRPFELWTQEEKEITLCTVLEIMTKIKSVYPKICFAFGSALGFVRDRGFIPHDKDIDIYVGLDGYTYPLNENDLSEIAEQLRALGLWVVWINEYGTMINLFVATTLPNLPVLDIYLCVVDENGCYYKENSIFEKYIPHTVIFPAGKVMVYGQQCPVPGQAERYFELTYGKNWRIPIDVNQNIEGERKRYRNLT